MTKVEGLELVYRLMEEKDWPAIDINAVETIMNTVYFLENPYESETIPIIKTEGIQLLHKLMKKQKLNAMDKKTLELTMYGVSIYERLQKN